MNQRNKILLKESLKYILNVVIYVILIIPMIIDLFRLILREYTIFDNFGAEFRKKVPAELRVIEYSHCYVLQRKFIFKWLDCHYVRKKEDKYGLTVGNISSSQQKYNPLEEIRRNYREQQKEQKRKYESFKVITLPEQTELYININGEDGEV